MPNNDEPFGRSLMARDNAENRKLFPNGPFGYEILTGNECTENDECPHYHYTQDATEEGAMETPIHILIAAFRDRLCGRTLHNIFRRASNPKRIWVRVFDQIQIEPSSDLIDDAGCWEVYCHEYDSNCDKYKDHVQIVKVDASESKGPTYARSKLSAMVNWDYTHRDEHEEIELSAVQENDFCMQIDSHMDFHDDYDTGLIAMHHRTQNDYAVLSTYVTDIEHNNKDLKTVPNLCMVKFTSSIRNWGTKECKKLVKPKMTNAMWGAGLSFHRCHAEINVPVDPYLDQVFDGEEGSRGIRFFTHGYDVYTPDKVLVTHDYHGHQNNPVVHTWGRAHNHGHKGDDGDEQDKGLPSTDWKWNKEIEDARDAWSVFGSRRVNMLLGLGSKFDSTRKERQEVERIRRSRFGLGTKRTLKQVREFTGINLLEEKMEVNRCGNLVWVPYAESIDYGLPQFFARGYDGKAELVLDQEEEKEEPLLHQVVSDTNNINNAAAIPSSGGLRVAAVAASELSPTSTTTFFDYRMSCGLLLLVVVVLLRLAVQRKKDERKKI